MAFALLYILGINIFTAYNYYVDKQAAINGGWRIPEKSLLFFALIGGSPAALLSTHYFRHKRRKNSFMDILYIIIGLQIVLISFELTGILPFKSLFA